jgi:hypothetical protein
MLRTVGTSGQLMLGKKFSGCHFQVEELSSGEIVLRPVRPAREAGPSARAKHAQGVAFRIAEVEQVVLPTREQRSARPK